MTRRSAARPFSRHGLAGAPVGTEGARPRGGGRFVFEDPQLVAWRLLALYGCLTTSVLSASLGLEESKTGSSLSPGEHRWAVVPVRANEPNGTSVWALERESVPDGRLWGGSPSPLCLAQGCLFPFSTLGLPFPALPAVASDHCHRAGPPCRWLWLLLPTSAPPQSGGVWCQAVGRAAGPGLRRATRRRAAMVEILKVSEMKKLIKGITYLDHAGSALFPESLLKAFTDDLRNNIYGNPHSQNISSKLTYDTIEHVRYRILQHFHTTAEDYTIIFTSGCTAALKLVAEVFPWIPEGTKQPSSRFCYLTDSHTSVVGMRGITASMNVLSVPIKPKEIFLSEKNKLPTEEQNCTTPHLFSYPAQSNFSGTKYPLSWIQDIKSGKLHPIKIPGKWFVLLDAASYVSSSPLDLGVHQADFIPISFYKIFGFPTGLGALLVNNRIAPLLRKTYFGGGTAAAYLAGEDFYYPRKSIAERFEDGTVSFLDIIALKHGFDVLEKLT
ncbi:PREDICTED: molybdenum cofactor sulfurase-like, partial [Phaethon lepturus]|uniref:molybdenum cofactor sulfurase-like n=1 Tax=Phaethon lepturus TaxID=97097 RepID=UPI000530790E